MASLAHHSIIGIRAATAALLLVSVACARGIAPHGGRIVAAGTQPLGSLLVRALVGDSLVVDQGMPTLRADGDDGEPIAPAALDRHSTHFDGLRPGRYVFTVRRVGFAPERWAVAISAGCRAVLEIRARSLFTCFDACTPPPPPPAPYARYDACAPGA